MGANIADPHDVNLDHGGGIRCATCRTLRRGINTHCIYCEQPKPRKEVRVKPKRVEPVQTMEDIEQQWFRMNGRRSKRYGRGLSSNMAAPFIARLRAQNRQA